MQQNPSGLSPTSTAAFAQAAQRPWKGAGAVLDTVRVAPETFRSVMFMSSAQRKVFTRDNQPSTLKPQKRTQEGVPLWSVQLAAVSWRGTSQLVTVTVPMHDDPADKFRPGDSVLLDGLVYGVTPKREGGYVVWCSADGMSAAAAA